jgi:large subunit ribosomal protein L9
MQVVLLQRVEDLGQMGDVVTVKAGFARNFLIPRKKALRATKENIAYFEGQRKNLEVVNQKNKQEAEAIAAKMDKLTVSVIRQAAESGKLFGSVSTRDIADAVNAKGFKTTRDQYTVNQSLKTVGLFPVKLSLHPEVSLTVTINIARTEEEAKIQQERGAALIKDAQGNTVSDKQADEQPEVDASAFLETKATDEEAA